MNTAIEQFSQYYKTISDSELILIIENADDYQAIAVEAAKDELQRRRLSATEMEALKKQLAENKEREEAAKQKREAIEQNIKTKFGAVFESLNPIQSELPAAEKIIRYVVLLWGLMTAYQILHDYRVEFEALKAFPFHPFVNSLILLPYVLLPLSIYQLWKRNASGWTLFVIYLSLTLMTELWALEFAITWKATGVRWIDAMIKPSIPIIFLRVLFIGGTLYAMCGTNIRSFFSVERKKMFLVTALTVAFWFLTFWGMKNQ